MNYLDTLDCLQGDFECDPLNCKACRIARWIWWGRFPITSNYVAGDQGFRALAYRIIVINGMTRVVWKSLIF